MRPRRSRDRAWHHPLERVWCTSIRSWLLLRSSQLRIRRLRRGRVARTVAAGYVPRSDQHCACGLRLSRVTSVRQDEERCHGGGHRDGYDPVLSMPYASRGVTTHLLPHTCSPLVMGLVSLPLSLYSDSAI